MNPTPNDIEQNHINSLIAGVPSLPADASSANDSSVVALPLGLTKEIHKGRLTFKLPPVQAGPVCYTNCICGYACVPCENACLATYTA